jgi:hypothetical protein
LKEGAAGTFFWHRLALSLVSVPLAIHSLRLAKLSTDTWGKLLENCLSGRRSAR